MPKTLCTAEMAMTLPVDACGRWYETVWCLGERALVALRPSMTNCFQYGNTGLLVGLDLHLCRLDCSWILGDRRIRPLPPDVTLGLGRDGVALEYSSQLLGRWLDSSL